MTREDHRHNQGPDQRPSLVHGFMQPEAESQADLLTRVGKHDVSRRIADRLADTFQNYEQSSDFPIRRPGQKWHGGHLNDVAEYGDRPELAGALAERAGNKPQAIPEQFTEARDNANQRSACAQDRQIRTVNAPRSFINEVGEKAHDSD